MMRPASAEDFPIYRQQIPGYGRSPSRMNVCSLQVFLRSRVCLPLNPVTSKGARMKNHVRSATGLLLVAIMISLMLPMTFRSPAGAVNARPAQPQSEQQTDLPKQLQPGVYKGEAVRRRINALRATNKALNRAMKDKEKVGKKVNWELSAVLVFSEEKKKQVAKLSLPKIVGTSFAPAQETLSDGTGEATFLTYNGPDSTWDGTISVTDYYTGENYVYNGEMWDFGATNDPAVWDVTYEAYYPPDGSEPVECPANEPCVIQPAQVKNEAGSSAASLMVNASYNPTMKSASPPGFIFRWFSSYWRCFSRTAAFVGRQCVSPQPNIRNSLICAMAAGVYAAGCCARFSGQNSGQGRCYP